MDHHYLFYPDYHPNFHANQLDQINRQWTRHDRNILRCTTGPAYFLSAQDGRESLDTLVLSESLAEKIQNALCIAHSYWTIPEKVAEEERVRFENEARAQAWEEELEHLIKITKKKVKKTGRAARDERKWLRELLIERKKCQKSLKYYQYVRQEHEDLVKLGKARWINAWFEVQQELDRLWVHDGQIKRYYPEQPHGRHGSRPRPREPHGRSRSQERRHRSSYREQRREARSRSTNHAQYSRNASRSRSRSQSRRRDSRSRHRGQEPQTRRHRSQDGSNERSRGQSRYGSQSRSGSRRHDHRQHHDRASEHRNAGLRNRPPSPASSYSHSQSDPELWRMAELICDTSETPPAHLEITAKPSCDWTRPDGYRAEASHIAERDVMPSVIVADDDELSFIDVSTDDSTEARSEQNLTHSTPISRQTGDFKDGLYRLALEYDKRDTLSPSPTNPSENLSYRRSGIKRKREDHELSERKSRKVVDSRNSVSEASMRKDSAIEWPQEETRVQGVAGRTPESMRMSIRDFFKPHQSRGQSLF